MESSEHPTPRKDMLCIIKIGGNVIDNASSLQEFLREFASLPSKKILVHGGGKIATSIGDKIGIASQYTNGRRITDTATIDLVTMVYGGLVNKKIVAGLQALRCNAIGLTGADANALPAVKRPVQTIDFGWVGDVTASAIDPSTWQRFLDNQLVPVVAPLTHDLQGHMLNTNADTIASVLAVALSKVYQVKLVYCFEKNGVLTDVNDGQTLITELTVAAYQQLQESDRLFAGILPKIDNSFAAVHAGVSSVVIGNSANLSALVLGESGTKIIA